MSIKKKMGMALASTALGAMLIGGGTFALFTSEAVNQGNTFSAGTVSIQDVTGGTLVSQEVNFDNLAPGDTGTMSMTVKNNGSLDAWVRINTAASDASKSGGLFGGATPLEITYDDNVFRIGPGETRTFEIGYEFPLEADDSYEDADGSFNVVVQAVQAKNNTNAAGDGPQGWGN